MKPWILPLILASSAVPAIVIFFLGEKRNVARAVLSLGGAVLKLGLILYMAVLVLEDQQLETRVPLLDGFELVLRGDALGFLFVTLSTVLWFVTTVYVVGYFREGGQRRRFFGFFNLCVTATVGIALSGNLITFLFFYELLTLSTYPLVVHRGDAESLRAGRTYLAYTLTGGAVLFFAIVWLHSLAGSFPFTQGGALVSGPRAQLVAIFALFIVGLGVKTAIVPLHSWLPAAMVAPAPVSALLHAVAVVKAGAFGIVRVVYEVYGVDLCSQLGVLGPLAAVACFTIAYAAVKALAQRDIKRLLAYSTISQVSYIVLGVALFGPLGSLGGVSHLVHQGIMKITLFFCAGIFAQDLGVTKLAQMDGLGRRMPLTTLAFTIGALGMMGLPPFAGFVSKWYLGTGALAAGSPWVIPVLLLSTGMNAAFFFPPLYAAWFKERTEPWPREEKQSARFETTPWLLAPPLVTAVLTILVGLFAASPFSVKAWVLTIVTREYLP